MATVPPVQEVPAIATNKAPIIPLILAIVLGVVASVAIVGGAGYYLIRSGKLRLQTMPPPQPATEAKTHAVVIEPLLVNLADASGTAYLRASITLRVVDSRDASLKDEDMKGGGGSSKEHGAALRDAALAVLGRESSETLLTPDGKERLKVELKRSLAERVPEIKVVDLYFTEFLVQR